MVDPDKGEIFYAGPQIPTMQELSSKKLKRPIKSSKLENDVNCAGLQKSVKWPGGSSCRLFNGLYLLVAALDQWGEIFRL